MMEDKLYTIVVRKGEFFLSFFFFFSMKDNTQNVDLLFFQSFEIKWL